MCFLTHFGALRRCALGAQVPHDYLSVVKTPDYEVMREGMENCLCDGVIVAMTGVFGATVQFQRVDLHDAGLVITLLLLPIGCREAH